MEKIAIKLTGDRLEAVCHTFLGMALSKDLTRKERAAQSLFVEVRTKMVKKHLATHSPEQKIKMSLKIYEADVLEGHLREWSYHNEKDYWYNLVMIVADELHQKLV